MAQSPSRPLWRMAFDSADRLIGPASEQLVRTEAFADLVGLASRMQHMALKRVERTLRQQWHLWNLPAGTDMKRLSEQIASLERQVRDLGRQLEDSRRPPRTLARRTESSDDGTVDSAGAAGAGKGAGTNGERSAAAASEGRTSGGGSPRA